MSEEAKKKNDDGTIKSYSDLRKYHNAIMYGVEQAHQSLPPQYYAKIDRFLGSCQKEMPFVALRGDWPIRRVLDIYWRVDNVMVQSIVQQEVERARAREVWQERSLRVNLHERRRF